MIEIGIMLASTLLWFRISYALYDMVGRISIEVAGSYIISFIGLFYTIHLIISHFR